MVAREVVGTVVPPGGIPAAYASVEIDLVASLTGRAIGWIATAGLGVGGRTIEKCDDTGSWSVLLQPNSLIDPANTVYRIRYSAGGWTDTFEISVPDVAGPHNVIDLLSTTPDDLPTNALNNEIAARIAGDAAEAATRAAADNLLDVRLDVLEADPTTQTAVDAVAAGLAGHLADTVDAHDASAISYTPGGTVAATDVQSAIAEVAAEAGSGAAAVQANLDAHLADTTAAHAASAVSFTPGGTIAATDAQAAIAEVASDAATALSAHEADTTSVHGIANTALLIDSGDVGLAGDIRQIDIGDAADAGATGRYADAGHQHALLAPAVPVALGSSAAAGVATRPARSDHVHPYPTAANVGADPAGTAATLVTAHEADTTSVHGIADTSALLDTGDIGSTVQAYDTDLANWAGKTAPAGVPVGTTDTQILSNKTLTAPIIGGSVAHSAPLDANGAAGDFYANGIGLAPADGTNGPRGDSIASDAANAGGASFFHGFYVNFQGASAHDGPGSAHGVAVFGEVADGPEYSEAAGYITTILNKRDGALAEAYEGTVIDYTGGGRNVGLGLITRALAPLTRWMRGVWLTATGTHPSGDAIYINGNAGWANFLVAKDNSDATVFRIDGNGTIPDMDVKDARENIRFSRTGSGLGERNISIGQHVGEDQQAGATDNIGIGNAALLEQTTGDNCVAIGPYALQNATTAGSQTAIGNAASDAVTTETGGTSIGVNAEASGGNYTTAIGAFAAAGANYATAIGLLASATAPGAVAIGADSGAAGATTSTPDEIRLGTANHKTYAPGTIRTGNSNTVGRPTATAVGEQWFDTTLGHPIWWDGTDWVDAAGNPV